MKRALCIYLHVHQPYRVRPYSIFDVGHNHDYFNDITPGVDTNNRYIIDKVAEKSYVPTNMKLMELLDRHPELRFSMSITGTIIEQLQKWRPDVLESFQQLVDTGRVEIVGETYHHSLAFFYDRQEFEAQVIKHKKLIQSVFRQDPRVFRGTELSYNNEMAQWADRMGYKAILSEGWDPILDWRSPNYVYRPAETDNIRLLMKNYKLSDDIAFRFSNKEWPDWPLTAHKFAHWLEAVPHDQPLINLFMDYETFGEHQWSDTGIFNFLDQLPAEFLKVEDRGFLTVSEAADTYEPAGEIDTPYTVTWADTERDLTAWTGNDMQKQALQITYDFKDRVLATHDSTLIDDWRKLQTSDHFYYMCTKWFNDGDVHAYFSPYETPYDAYLSFMNATRDIELRLLEREQS